MKEPGPKARFSLSLPWMILLSVLVILLEAWSRYAADPDFWLPDPFPFLVIWVMGVFLATGFIQSSYRRSMSRMLLAIVPVALLLAFEPWAAFRDVQALGQIERTSDPLLRYHYRPGAFGGLGEGPVNSQGLRDHEYARPKPPGTWRVVLLGDSVPNDGSIPFDLRFKSVLEQRLREVAPPGLTVEVVNVSCEGYNTLQEVRLLEQVGLGYQPDLVVLAYVVNDPYLQDGSARRMGSSFFLFRFVPLVYSWFGADCKVFEPMHRSYGFHLAVTEPMERLRMNSLAHGFEVVVATLPLVTAFDDPVCGAIYDQVGDLVRRRGFTFVRVVDAFQGEDPRDFLKPGQSMDNVHPNAAGHARIADVLFKVLRTRMPSAAPAAPASAAVP